MKKDKKPYLIFACTECNQYSYVKISQKTKKCLRCGKTHQVKNLKHRGIIVEGINNTVNILKEKQNIFAINELGGEPDFHSEKEFSIVSLKKPIINNRNTSKLKNSQEFDYSDLFKRILFELSKNPIYDNTKKVPKYFIEMIAKDYKIPNSEINSLFSKFIKDGFLIVGKNQYFTIRI